MNENQRKYRNRKWLCYGILLTGLPIALLPQHGMVALWYISLAFVWPKPI